MQARTPSDANMMVTPAANSLCSEMIQKFFNSWIERKQLTFFDACTMQDIGLKKFYERLSLIGAS